MKNLPKNVITRGTVTLENVEFFGDEDIVLSDSSLKDMKIFGKTTIEKSTVCNCAIRESKIVDSKVSGKEISNSFVSESDINACVVSGASVLGSKMERSGFSGGKCNNSTLSNFSTYASCASNSSLSRGFMVYSCCEDSDITNIGMSESLISCVLLELKTKPINQPNDEYVVLFKDNKIIGNKEAIPVIKRHNLCAENSGSLLIVSAPV